MSIELSSNFDLVAQLPLDARYIATDITDRDAITTIRRYEGMMVYVLSDQVTYQLQNGITNADWYPIGTGAAGRTVLNGIVPPTTEGVNGDFYIDTVEWDIYGPKAAGVWPAGVSLIGPAGATGATGAPGPSVEVEWEGVSISAITSKINLKGPGVASVVETAPGEVEITIQGGGGGEADGPLVFGECAVPLDIPVSGLSVADDNMSQESMNQLIFVQGDGGPIDITANPQIGKHVFIGAMLTIVGRSNTNTLTLQDGDGLVLNGTAVLGLADVIRLMWNGSLWVERRRNF